MTRMEMIKNKINSLPVGSTSDSNHYWCVTCKKFFVLDKPVCPYMTGMCINTPIAVENLAPESTEALEKFGLFYPKIPQKILSELLTNNLIESGKKLAEIYVDFLNEWKFQLAKEQPLQTLKSFIIILSGCETAQRVNENAVTFVLMDAEKIWKKEQIKLILTGAIDYLKDIVGIHHELNIDFIDIIGEREIGKYFCAKCGMFFEFGLKKSTVTCPLMAQKCMFDPQCIDNVDYSSDKLLKQFEITPDIYKRMIKSLNGTGVVENTLKTLLKEWKIDNNLDQILNTLI